MEEVNRWRLAAMVEMVKAKAGDDGRFTSESVWMAWKGWDFGQKREPSPWLTFSARRMLARARRSSTGSLGPDKERSGNR